MADSRLNILIQAKNNASGPINQAKADVGGLDKAAGSLSGGLGGLAAVAGVAGIAALGAAAASATMDLSRLAAQATDVESSFKTMAAGSGQSAQSMLEGLTGASRGAISDFDLMLTANRAMLLGVAQNTDDMIALMDVARARSQAMGLTTVQAFGDIVTGIGRMSPMILDNLGIVVDAAAANQEYAQSVGKAVGQLSEQEKKQALVNAVIRDSVDLVRANEEAGDDAASKFERMDAALQNAKVALGELFSPAVAVVAQAIADAAQAAADGLEAATGPVAQARHEMEGLTAAQAGTARQAAALTQEMTRLEAAGQKDTEAYRNLAAGLALTQQEITRNNAAMELARRAMMDEATAARMAAGGTAELRGEFVKLSEQAATTTSVVDDLTRSLNNEALARSQRDWMAMTSAIEGAAAAGGRLFAGKQGDTAGLTRQREISDELTAQIGYWRIQGYEMEQINDVLLPGYVANIQEADQALFKTVTQTKGLSDAAKEAERAFSDLKGKVSGVLQAALDPGVGVDPNKILESFGFSEDRINENARRLADIAANGLKGQDWLGEFAAEAPNVWKAIRSAVNPQEEAAFLLRDFQDGLRPELIDKERAKDLVRRVLTGDANMAELAQEIAAELAAEMGVSMQTALGAAQGALGVGGMSGIAGGDAATAFADSATATMGERGGGGEMVDAFIAQARSVYGRLRTAGQDAGKEFGSGFLVGVSDVPASFVNLLVGLVLPGVRSGLNTDATLQGAVNP